jgi:hypothetical protein
MFAVNPVICHVICTLVDGSAVTTIAIPSNASSIVTELADELDADCDAVDELDLTPVDDSCDAVDELIFILVDDGCDAVDELDFTPVDDGCDAVDDVVVGVTGNSTTLHIPFANNFLSYTM